jgi:hypothetical protein
MIKRARQALLLVDGSKFGRPALTQIAELDDVAVSSPPTCPRHRSSRSCGWASTFAASDSIDPAP